MKTIIIIEWLIGMLKIEPQFSFIVLFFVLFDLPWVEEICHFAWSEHDLFIYYTSNKTQFTVLISASIFYVLSYIRKETTTDYCY
jgi:hypothetical protein